MTVVLFAAAVVLITAGIALLSLDRRRPTAVQGRARQQPREQPPEPGSLFRDIYDRDSG